MKVYPVEVGCRGFVASSTTKLLTKMGVRGLAHRRTVKNWPAPLREPVTERTGHWSQANN